MGRIVFVTGGARSGKSAYAQSRTEAYAGGLLYVATAEVRDAEMAARVARHQEQRGERWRHLEAPLDLVGTVPAAAEGCSALLLDCLTLWLSNLLEVHGDDDEAILAEAGRLIPVLQALAADVFVVSNELGGGVVPDNRLARRFRDLHGLLNQQFAAAAAEAWLVVAGLPLQLK